MPLNENDTDPADVRMDESTLDDAAINEANNESVTALPDELQKLRDERDSLFDRLARATADFQNSRKRLSAEAEQNLQYANSNLIKSLLPVIDNFERAMAIDFDKAESKSVLKGLQLVSEQLNKVLKSQMVEEIAPAVGDAFDPTKHEALMQQASDDVEAGHITQLLQRGYQLRDRTLRPAQVAVAKSN